MPRNSAGNCRMAAESRIHRRTLLGATAAGLCSLACEKQIAAQVQPKNDTRGKPTRFQIACMTLPYSQYPLARALSGIKSAGYEHVAWGTAHKEAGESKGV